MEKSQKQMKKELRKEVKLAIKYLEKAMHDGFITNEECVEINKIIERRKELLDDLKSGEATVSIIE